MKSIGKHGFLRPSAAERGLHCPVQPIPVFSLLPCGLRFQRDMPGCKPVFCGHLLAMLTLRQVIPELPTHVDPTVNYLVWHTAWPTVADMADFGAAFGWHSFGLPPFPASATGH